MEKLPLYVINIETERKKIEIWVNLQWNGAQDAMKIKETLPSGIYIETEMENSKFGPICNEKDLKMPWKSKITPQCDFV